ncbi:Beta-elim-lyase domain-containing protein [Fusarium sp. LHS14.1]|nr:Beta-elim-lyase domain-containing protein [Fusarium sp. LHS14.1]
MHPGGFLAAPWRIKMIERIRQSTREQREKWIRAASYNLFKLQSDQVLIDLLTDSGTGAMSDRQWAALILGDETYAGSSSFSVLHGKVTALFGFPYILPVHQGRAAENALFSVLVSKGDVVPGNSHFDTTRAHIEYRQATAVDCPLDNAFCIGELHPFKGNIDLHKLKTILDSENNVPMILMTVTCNKTGGQPVSLDNMRRVRALAREYCIPVVFDSARFAENAWFIQKREPGYSQKTIKEIVGEMHQCADAMVMSAKKDCNGNIGGILAMRDGGWFPQASDNVILFEGFTKYGGMTGRDMEALAVGLDEATCSDYLDFRIGQVQLLGDRLIAAGIPIQRPVGGHAIVVDAGVFLPLVPKDEYAAQVLAVELYLEAGVRGVEMGTLMNDRDPDTGRDRHAKAEFMRLAIPRRVYTNDQLDVVAQALIRVYRRRLTIVRGFRILDETKRLRHFTVTLERAGDSADAPVGATGSDGL